MLHWFDRRLLYSLHLGQGKTVAVRSSIESGKCCVFQEFYFRVTFIYLYFNLRVLCLETLLLTLSLSQFFSSQNKSMRQFIEVIRLIISLD